MVTSLSRHMANFRWRRLWLTLALALGVWMVAWPASFVGLWLTPDQQGRLWFQLGDYDRASRAFENPRWRGFSLYAGEDFATAERYFSQYQDTASMLARANALAHQADYTAALEGYKELAAHDPDHPAPVVNIPVMQAIIEAAEGATEDDGSSDSGKKPGQGSESSDGSGEEGAGELEQLRADQLLQDPSLTDMWLRQIQRDPSEFITTKFYMQLEQNKNEEPQ